MNRRKTERSFDCIGFKRGVQAEIYEEIKGLSPEEEIAYFRREAASGPLGKWWEALGRRSRAAGGANSRQAPDRQELGAMDRRSEVHC